MRRSVYHPRTIAIVLAVACFTLLLAGGRPLYAAPPGQSFGGDPLNPFPTLFPELAELPAPAWLQEGLRVSYYGQSATVGANSSGGAGYIQHDIVAMEPELVVVSSALYLDSGNGQVLPTGVFGAAFLPGYGDWWLNPAVLVDAERVASEELAVVRMPATIAGEAYEAVRFEYTSDESVSVWMFEAKSGILIYNRLTIGTVDDAKYSSAETYLVNRRTLKLPWQGKRTPSWAKRGVRLDFEGMRSLTIAGTPSGQFPEAAYVELETTRPRWSRYSIASYFNGQPQGTSTRVCGVAQLSNALWLPAEALKATVRRPLIDRDPVTGIETYYTRSGSTVRIETRGPLHYAASTYDGRTGTLLQSDLETQIGPGTTFTELALQ